MSVTALFGEVLEEISSVAFFLNEGGSLLDSFLSSHSIYIVLAAELVFNLSFACELTDGDSDRNSDEVCVVELNTRTLVSVVYHYLYAHILEFLLDIVRQIQLSLIA